MKHSALRRALLCLALSAPLGLLPACAARQDVPDTSIDVEAQKATVTDFITQLYATEVQKVLALTGFPFYLNHQAILSYPEEWQRTLQELFLNAKPSLVSNLNLVQLTTRQLELENPRVWARLLQYNFDTKIYWLASIQREVAGKPTQERVLILLSPTSGKVVGFIR